MNYLYRLLFIFLGFFSYATHAGVRTIKSLTEFETHVLKPSGGSIVFTTIEDVDPRTGFSNALPEFQTISNAPEFQSIRFSTVNINQTPDIFIWLSTKGKHIAEWPAFMFIENGEIKAIETGIHGPSLQENLKAHAQKHFKTKVAPAATTMQHKAMPKQKKSMKRRRPRNGRSRTRPACTSCQ